MRAILPFVLLLAPACASVRPAPAADDGRLAVGFLLLDGVYGSELVAPHDVFQHTIFHTEPGMRVFTVAPTHAVVTSFEGLRLIPDHSFADAPRIDVLVVPSAEHNLDTDLEDERLIAWVRRVGGEADWLVSACDGAFLLAEAGLLDGLASTTFPGDLDAYEARYPHLDVRHGVSFVHDGKAVTSMGGARSYDPAMYLVELLYGERVARGVGRGLCIDWDVRRVPHVVGERAVRR